MSSILGYLAGPVLRPISGFLTSSESLEESSLARDLRALSEVRVLRPLAAGLVVVALTAVALEALALGLALDLTCLLYTSDAADEL